MSNQTLSKFNFGHLENLYIETTDLSSRLSSRIEEWADLLESDEDGNTLSTSKNA